MSSEKLSRSEIDFGKIDAKSALVTRDIKSKNLFIKSYTVPEYVDFPALYSGDKFLIYGTKGSGKTALLRYIIEKEKERKNLTKIIVFQEDISKTEKELISRNIDLENILVPEVQDEIDVREMWSIFIVKQLVDMLSRNTDMFEYSRRVEALRKLISEIFESGDKNFLSKISNKIKDGHVKITADLKSILKIDGLFNWKNDESEVSVTHLYNTVVDELCSFVYPDDVKYCLYFDEINISMVRHKNHKRDAILIRDLVFTIGRLNRIFVERNVPIFIYAAIRVEVARVASISRNEIDKYLIDHGQELKWNSGFEVDRYPIFNIIENRILAIERQRNIITKRNSEIWNKYFTRDIFGVSPKKFISEITWCNPRDIVTLFNLARNSAPHEEKYSTNVFYRIMQQYSDKMWEERAEELNAEYPSVVVSSIKNLITGFSTHYKLDWLRKRAEEMSRSDSVLMQTCKTTGIDKIAKDLYYIGVFGQSNPRQKRIDKFGEETRDIHETWFYRDNVDFNPDQWLIVHKGLYQALRLKSIRASDLGRDPRVVERDQL